MAYRILLFTGKGGVGKTTCAAATAYRSALLGYRTLVMSSDPAHSLADAFDLKLGPEPKEILPNLFAQEVDLYYSMKKYWGNIRELLLLVLKWRGVADVASEELAAIPGMGEASSLLWLDQFYNSKDFDVIIIDSAPTGETLSFLTLPQLTEWWLMKAFPFQKLALQSVGFAVRKTTGVPLDKGYSELKQLIEKLKLIHDVLSDNSVTSIRLVCNPEKMVIQEARRAYTYLQLYGFGVDSVIVNRVMEISESESELWQSYMISQEKYLKEIDSSFSPLPIKYIPHQREEVLGISKLEKISELIYKETDPTKIFYSEKTFKISSEKNKYFLDIKIPFIEDDKFNIDIFGDQLVIQIKNQRRHYSLPNFLSYYKFKDTEVNKNWLRVIFDKDIK